MNETGLSDNGMTLDEAKMWAEHERKDEENFGFSLVGVAATILLDELKGKEAALKTAQAKIRDLEARVEEIRNAAESHVCKGKYETDNVCAWGQECSLKKALAATRGEEKK